MLVSHSSWRRPASWASLAIWSILYGQTADARKLTGRFLHITDIHPDPYYRANASVSASCHHNRPYDDPERAGWLGAPVSECDTPPSLVDHTFDWLEKNLKHDVDFVIWTGDNARHDIDTSYPRSLKEIFELNKDLVGRFERLFEDRDIPVVPSLGNNDIYPHNIIRPGPNAITSEFAKIWKTFVPAEEYHTVARGAYFSREVIPDELVVVSLNTMYFFDNNKVVDGCPVTKAGQTPDPGTLQLDWLVVQLNQWRRRGMQVWLSGHVPPTQSNWYEGCLDRFTEISVAFQDTIVGQMFGHVNVDTFSYLDWSNLPDGNKRKSKRKSSARNLSVKHNEDSVSITKFVHNDLYEVLSALPSKKKMKLENFAIVHTGPSVIPTYLPSLRIWHYNISNPDDKYWPTEGGSLPSEPGDRSFRERWQKRTLAILRDIWYGDLIQQFSTMLDLDLVTSKRRRRHGKKKKKPIVRLPRYSSPLSPSRINRYLSPLGYTQYYLPIDKHTHPNWTIEYVTYPQERLQAFLPNHLLSTISVEKVDAPYHLEDLTIIKWLDLAKRLTSSKKKWTQYVKRMYVSSGAEQR